MATQMGFMVDLERCVGCNSCAVACKAENNTRPEARPGTEAGAADRFRGTVEYRRVIATTVDRLREDDTTSLTRRFVSTACNHCDEPSCMAVCPGRAIYKDHHTGVVLINHTMCLGCRSCQFACPFNGAQFNGMSGRAQKCTFCQHRLAKDGVEPACVATCTSKALRYTNVRAAEDVVDGEFISTYDGPEAPGDVQDAFPTQDYDRTASTYETVLGSDSGRHAQTKPNTYFTGV